MEGFEWDTALVTATLSHDGGEPRLMALGLIGERLHALVFSIDTAQVRVISLRRSNKREIRRYEQAAD